MPLSTCFRRLIVVSISFAALGAHAQKLPPVDKLPIREELPDPFTMLDGSNIETPEDWYEKRRPELKKLFQHYVYGYQPPAPEIEVSEDAPPATILGGKALLKQLRVTYKDLPGAPPLHLALFLPTHVREAVPVFIGIDKCGNHTVVSDPNVIGNTSVYYHESCPSVEEGRGTKEDFWCVEYLVSRGYALAVFHESDVDPDKHDFTDGIHAHYDLEGPAETHWGTISAWAWGFHRAMDALEREPAVDSDRMCLIGHSRRGKTALFAAAMDERVALVVPHQSGTGGMALSRNNDQETVERINRVFPHWFNDNFTRFNDNESQLPVDQHLLVALVAPRALLDTAGLQDTWANYESAYRNIQAADEVYKFLGAKGVVGDGLLTAEDQITEETAGNLMQYRLDTRHTLNADYWKAILDFADLNLK